MFLCFELKRLSEMCAGAWSSAVCVCVRGGAAARAGVGGGGGTGGGGGGREGEGWGGGVSLYGGGGMRQGVGLSAVQIRTVLFGSADRVSRIRCAVLGSDVPF